MAEVYDPLRDLHCSGLCGNRGGVWVGHQFHLGDAQQGGEFFARDLLSLFDAQSSVFGKLLISRLFAVTRKPRHHPRQLTFWRFLSTIHTQKLFKQIDWSKFKSEDDDDEEEE